MRVVKLLKLARPVSVAVTGIVLAGCVTGPTASKTEYSQMLSSVITADFMYKEYPQLSSCFNEPPGVLRNSLDHSINHCRDSQLSKIADNEILTAAAQNNFTTRITKCGLFEYLKQHDDAYKGNQDGSCSKVARMYRNITQGNVEVF